MNEQFRPNLNNSLIYMFQILNQVNIFLANYLGEPFMENINKNSSMMKLIFGILSIAMFVFGFVLALTSDYYGFDRDVSELYTENDYERLTLTTLNAKDSCELPYVIDPDRPLPYQPDE